MTPRNDNPTVYSTESGRICPKCGRPVAACVCAKALRPKGDGVVRVRLESKGRGGKTVTTIQGLDLDDEALRALAAELKRRCGTGGTIKDGVIEIQGNHADLLVQELKQRGFTTKRAGG
jgi:translation initiation factor 1